MRYECQQSIECLGIASQETCGLYRHRSPYGRPAPEEAGRKNRDPETKPWESPYAVFGGNPIWHVDILGNTDNTYDVDVKNKTFTKVDDKGGDKTDYINIKNVPVKEGSDEVLNGGFSYSTKVKNKDWQGHPRQEARLPGVKYTGVSWNGKTEPVDDPFTSIGPGIIYSFSKKAVIGLVTKLETQTVYRVFGGDARAMGFSWSPVNPEKVSNYRNLAGLPSGGASGSTNTADFLLKGKVNFRDITRVHPAEPLDGNIGGLLEYKINPQNVKIIDFKILKR